MQRKYFLSALFLLLLLCVQTQAKEVTVVFKGATDRFEKVDDKVSSITKDGVTITASNGDWCGTGTEYRWYNSNKTIISSSYCIKKIVFSREGVTKNPDVDCRQIKLNEKEDITYSKDYKTATWTWDGKTNISKVTFNNSGSSLWLSSITVTLEISDMVIDGSNSSADNGSIIASNDKGTNLEVVLKRKFVADGGWYTLCLPFYRTEKQIKEAFGDEVEICEFTSAKKLENGYVQIVFSPTTRQYPIVNGVPYLIRPSKDTEDEVVFHNVNMHNVAPEVVEHDGVKFIGIYDPYEIPYNDKHYRFLVGNEGLTLKFSNVEGSKVKGTRAYFVFPDDQSDVAERVAIAGYDAVKVEVVIADKDGSDAPYYTLSGLKIDGKPAKRGIYIHNGQKVCLP